MTINHAIQNLRPGKAAKRPCMRGYIHMKDITPVVEPTGEGDFPAEIERKTAVAIVDKDGNETVFRDGGDAECRLDKTLFDSLCADDWEIADRDDYEKARVGEGRW